MPPQPVFYYDLASPACYLAAERVMAELPIVPEWEPVISARLGFAPSLNRATIEQQAADHELAPRRWGTGRGYSPARSASSMPHSRWRWCGEGQPRVRADGQAGRPRACVLRRP